MAGDRGKETNMDCVEFETRLRDRLDQRLQPDTPELQVHVHDCHACRQVMSDAKLLLKGISAWKQAIPKIDLTDRLTFGGRLTFASQASSDATAASHTGPSIRSALIRTQVQPASSGYLARGLIALTATALCYMFIAGPIRFTPQELRRELAQQQRNKPKSGVDQEIHHVPTVQAPSIRPDDLKIVLASAEGAYSHLANETVAVAQDFALLMPSGKLFGTSANTGVQDSDSPMLPASGILPTNVYPVGDSVESALQLLWQAVPGDNQSSKSS